MPPGTERFRNKDDLEVTVFGSQRKDFSYEQRDSRTSPDRGHGVRNLEFWRTSTFNSGDRQLVYRTAMHDQG
jgi:hypothetical protein